MANFDLKRMIKKENAEAPVRNRRFSELLKAFVSHAFFLSFLLSNGDIKIDSQSFDCELEESLMCGYYFATVLDKYFKRDSDHRIIGMRVCRDYLDQIAKKIAVPYGTGWKVGELSYSDSEILFGKLRNKLEHEYIVEDGKIVFYENGLKGEIPLDGIESAIAMFEKNIDRIKSYGKSSKIFVASSIPKDNQINNEKDFDDFCKNVNVLEIIDVPLPGVSRDVKYVDNMDTIKNKMYECLKRGDYKWALEYYYSKVKPLLSGYGMNVTYSLKRITDLDCYSVIKKNFFEDYENNKNLKGEELEHYLANRVLKLNNGQYQSFSLSKGLFLNMSYLKELRKNHDLSLNDYAKKNGFERIISFDLNNMFIAGIVTGFNAFLQYGLDNGLTKQGVYSFLDIVRGRRFDFSKLDMSKFVEPDVIYKHKFNVLFDDISNYNNHLASANDKINIKKINLQNFLSSTTPESPGYESKLERLDSEIRSAELEYDTLACLIYKMGEYYKDFDFNKFIENFNLVEFVRNAASHGWIYVDEHDSGDFLSRKIIIKDYENDGTLVYKKEMTVGEFASIFNSINYIALAEFFYDNCKDKSLVDGIMIPYVTRKLVKED